MLAGQKRATTGDLWPYEVEHEGLPQVGDLNAITDWDGNAVFESDMSVVCECFEVVYGDRPAAA